MGLVTALAVIDLALQFRPGRVSFNPTPFNALVLVIVTTALVLTIYVVERLIVLERESAELARRRGQDFELLYEQASDGIFVTTPELRFLHGSARGLAMIGYSLDELRTRTLDDITAPDEREAMRARVAGSAPGGSLASRRRLVRKDGSSLSVEVGATRMADGRWVAIVRDVTARVAAETELAAKEAMLAQLVSSYPGVIYHGRRDDRWVMDYVTDGCVALTGYEAGELQFDGVPALVGIVHPDDRDWLVENCARAIAQRLPCRNEYRIVTKDRTVRWVLEQAEGTYDAQGALVGVAGYLSDISARKESEAQVRRSERSLALAQRTAQLGSWRWDAPGGTLEGSDELFRIHGLAPGGPLPESEQYLALVHEEDRTALRESLAGICEGIQGPDLHFRVRRPDGAVRHLHAAYVIDRGEADELTGAHGVVQDVTEHWRAQEALRESEANYRLLFEHAGEAVIVVDRERRVHLANARVVELLDRPLERIRGRHVRECLTAGDADVALAQLDEVFATGVPVEAEVTLDFPAGRRLLRRTIRPVGVNGGTRFAIVFENDITDQRALQSALEASARRARQLLETTQEGFILADDRGVIVEVNAAYAAMVGYAAAELVGRSITSMEAELDEAAVAARIATMLREGGARFVTHHRRKDGTRVVLQVSAAVLTQDEGALVAAFVRDITEERTREAQLESSRQQLRALAARLEAVREEERTNVAREIHDELGQGLTSLKLDLAWLRDQLPATKRAARARGAATLDEVDRMIDAVRALAARLRPAILDDLGLVPAVEWQAARILERAGLSWQGTFELSGGVSPEQATTLFRIFQEAVTNVVRHAHATHVDVSLRGSDDVVELRVADDGRGFEGDPDAPDAHEGHLGLLGMRERASGAGGSFEIRARAGGGTEVIARIPRAGPGGSA